MGTETGTSTTYFASSSTAPFTVSSLTVVTPVFCSLQQTIFHFRTYGTSITFRDAIRIQLFLLTNRTRPHLPPFSSHSLAAIGNIVHTSHEDYGTNHISEGDRDDVVGHHLTDGDVGAKHHAVGDEEHVGDGVLKAQADEGGNRPEDGEDFARDGRGGNRAPHAKAHEPVAEHSFGEACHEGQVALHSGHGHGGGGRRAHSCKEKVQGKGSGCWVQPWCRMQGVGTR